VIRRLLWLEYREVAAEPYGYCPSSELYRLWTKHLEPSMRPVYKAGEEIFVDYPGLAGMVIDPETAV
jgi:transposase